MLTNIVLVIHILACLLLILLVLLHSGKGGGLSDMFGGTNTLSGGTSIERRLDQITVVDRDRLRLHQLLARLEVDRLVRALGRTGI